VTEAEWRPACGSCGSTAIGVTTARCAECGAEWDGTEVPQAAREGAQPSPVARPPVGDTDDTEVGS
jgi:hypothetical protein